MSQFANGSIAPILVPLITEFSLSVEQASRLITLNILATGIGVRRMVQLLHYDV